MPPKELKNAARGGHALAAFALATTASACAADIRIAATARRGLKRDDERRDKGCIDFDVDFETVAAAAAAAAITSDAAPQVTQSTADA